MRKLKGLTLAAMAFSAIGCAGKPIPMFPSVPSVDYSNQVRTELGATSSAKAIGSKYSPKNAPFQSPVRPVVSESTGTNANSPQIRFAADRTAQTAPDQRASIDPNFETNLIPQDPTQVGSVPGDYNGALSLGDPGVSASLWRDASGSPDFFRDTRAWQPMDLITILISESASGSKEADTEIKSKSTVQLAIENLLGYEDSLTESNPDLNLQNMVNASSQNDFKGEGETTRKDELEASISAMVVEVLPSGILRIEGTKIIAVNNEEQVMMLSGLVRPRDISANNEIQSTRIANMRIDYYGSGQVGSAQREGWLGHILRKVWPF